MATVSPYLNFSGTCEEAFIFYHAVFGGESPVFSRFSEMPVDSDGNHQMSETEANLIMHVSLPVGDTVLMGSDRPAAMGPTTSGNSSHISVGTKGKGETTRIFNGLAEGGTITMPLDEMFWGAMFGMVVDKYGVQWMVNGEPEAEG